MENSWSFIAASVPSATQKLIHLEDGSPRARKHLNWGNQDQSQDQQPSPSSQVGSKRIWDGDKLEDEDAKREKTVDDNDEKNTKSNAKWWKARESHEFHVTPEIVCPICLHHRWNSVLRTLNYGQGEIRQKKGGSCFNWSPRRYRNGGCRAWKSVLHPSLV